MQTLRVAIVGFGGIARSHYTAYHRLVSEGYPVRVVAICDRHPDRVFSHVTTNLRDENTPLDPTTHLYSSIDELLSRETFDIADVCLPTLAHKDAVLQLLRAGKHVLCEKPLALTSEESEAMVAAAHEADRLLMVAHLTRFDPHYLFLRDAVRDGRFGKLLHLSLERLSEYPTWSPIFHTLEKNGGCILDMQIHDIDVACMVLGAPKAASTIRCDDLPYHQLVSTRLFYEAATVTIEEAWDNTRTLPFFAGFCARFERASVRSDGKTLTVYPKEGEKSVIETPQVSGFYEEIRALCEAVRGHTEAGFLPPEQALLDIRIVEATAKSAALGGATVTL
ncbi:MAG: Gfo/Idh/MocA family oxidoreductase [Clostridia bacterium]|nr:Gfo/Idh/MocA family oxidoreductase [Clostridia bacterium]